MATSFQYPIRPEFVESTWYLYRVGIHTAMREHVYVDFQSRLLETHSISMSGVSDVESQEHYIY